MHTSRTTKPVESDRASTVGPESRPLSDVAEAEASTAWAMVEASPDALVMVDEHGLIELANRQTELLFGYDRGELLGRPVELLLPERISRAHIAHRTRFHATPEVRPMGSGIDLFARRADGSEISVEISLSPVDLHGELRVIAAIRDVSERVAAEAFDLEIRHGLDVVEDGVFMFAADTLTYRYVNQGAVDQTGYTRDELLAMTPLHLEPEFDESSFRQMLAAVVTDEVPSVHYTTVHRRKDGADIPVEIVLQVAPLERLAKTRSCIALVRDISERLEIQQGLAAAQRKASVLEDRERIGRDMHDTVIGRLFAAGMGIQASIGYLNDPVLQERFSALVDEIDTSINEIRTTIYGIRSQPDWGEGLRGRILEVAAKRSRPLGFEPTIDLHGPIDDLPMHIGDDLLATIQEALSNIAKHARANAVIINVEVTTTHLDVRIEDDGVGISATSGVESQTPLTGHGVANMTARAETLNGTATISSTPGHGTTISWTIPLP